VFPVNPRRAHVLGVKAYKSVLDVPEPIDLTVIVTPAQTVPGIIDQCAQVGVKGAIVISAGFKETGEQGAELERQIMEKARGMRVVGPNCLGIMSPLSGLNATFANAMARPGSVGFISQSGALCAAILDWSLHELVGFSAFVSIGSMLDVGWGDLIQYLGDDPQTHSIVIYMESVGQARAFLSAAREVALSKPIIVIKPGRTEAGKRAAATHTGSLTGSDEVLEAAFRRCGVLRVNEISDLFNMSQVLAKQPRPKGPRLTIVTNAGGPGVLATDALISDGSEIAELAPETIQQLDTFLPEHWSHGNPIDILGDAGPDRYAKAVEIAAKDPNTDGLLVILTPQAMSDPTQTAEHLRAVLKLSDRPILASWMGGSDIVAGEDILNRADIPSFRYPDVAAHAFHYLWRYSYNLRALYETPRSTGDVAEELHSTARAEEVLKTVRDQKRRLLTEYEAKKLLAAYGIPTVRTEIAQTEDQAVEWAEVIGYPVVLKLHSETITHKTDVGGVQLNQRTPEGVRGAFRTIQSSVEEKVGAAHFQGVTVQPMIRMEGYELILGSSIDPQFGPVLLFGAGGQLVEVNKDRALGLPPLNTTLARRMIEQTKVYSALKGVRGRKPVDLAALDNMLVRFSRLVSEQRWIQEIDINPLLASPEGLIALDARVTLHDAATREEDLPSLAIRPYPEEYVSTGTTEEGESILFRPIRPEDEPMIIEFHRHLSQQSVYLRYFYAFQFDERVRHERLSRICFIDYDRSTMLVAEHRNPETGGPEILGVVGLQKTDTSDGEYSILVRDDWQSRRVGIELMERIIEVAKRENLGRVVGDILLEDRRMRQICEQLGFRIQATSKSNVLRAEYTIPQGEIQGEYVARHST